MPCTINLKLSSMATNNCFISHPPLFATTKLSKSYSLKPFNNKLHLSCSSSCSSSLPFILSLTNKKPHYFKTSVSVLSTDEENTLVLDGQEQDFNFDNDQEGEFQEPSEDAKVFVGNLPLDIDSAALAGIFEKAGFVEMAEVIYNRETDRSRGFAFVTMSTVEEAEKAVEMFNRYDIKGGKLLTVTKALRRGEAVERPPRTFEPSYKIYVGNLPYSVDEARLEQLFSEHGQVVNVKVLYDRETGQSRGFGFVTMASEAEMVNTIANLDGQNLEGRSIRVNAAEDKRRSTD